MSTASFFLQIAIGIWYIRTVLTEDIDGNSIFLYVERIKMLECSQQSINNIVDDFYNSILMVYYWVYFYCIAVFINFIIDFVALNVDESTNFRIFKALSYCFNCPKLCQKKEKIYIFDSDDYFKIN
jgi:hypothetical protein